MSVSKTLDRNTGQIKSFFVVIVFIYFACAYTATLFERRKTPLLFLQKREWCQPFEKSLILFNAQFVRATKNED